MSKKKIGIITFHRADNLGAVLQTFALQTVLERHCNANAEVIDYRCKALSNSKKTDGVASFLKSIPLKLYYYIKSNGFNKFRNERLNLSKPYTRENIDYCVSNYDAIITGSDQVWNFECSDNDTAYFLDFVNGTTKKYSYAASVGNYIFTKENDAHVTNLLSDFCGISVREKSCKEKLQSLSINGVSVHPDPVMLLSREEWQDFIPKRLCRKKYVLVYLIQPDVNVLASAKRYAEENNCKIINNKKSIEFILHNSPLEFLSWVYHAQAVFTNSFHGSAFSILFNKKLAADIALKNGKPNERVLELLNETDNQDCIIKPDNTQVNSAVNKGELDANIRSAIEYLKQISS